MHNRELLVTTKNTQQVYYDPVDSHAATHFEDTPQLKDLVIEALQKLELTEDKVDELPIDMGRIIGMSDGVTNNPGDEIVYGKRKNRDVYTPFNKTQGSRQSSILVVLLNRISAEAYVLETAFIGTDEPSSPPFPGGVNETAESKPYWMAHSLAYGTQEIQPGTETSKCPW
jgi:hypothetical protein